jgi:hypothetical protein
MMVHIGRNLEAIISGEKEAIEVIFDGTGLVEEMYAEDVEDRPALEKAFQYISTLAYKSPNMKILEIGAGTGATTSKIMQILSSFHPETMMAVGRTTQVWGVYIFRYLGELLRKGTEQVQQIWQQNGIGFRCEKANAQIWSGLSLR